MSVVLWEIAILTALLWLLSVGFIIFSWVVSYRQMEMFKYINKRLEHIDSLLTPKSTPAKRHTVLSIPDDEPIAKYETMTLPDDVQVSFVGKDR